MCKLPRFPIVGLGDYFMGTFQDVFLELDEECETKLSRGKTRRDKKKWAGDDLWLQVVENSCQAVFDF